MTQKRSDETKISLPKDYTIAYDYAFYVIDTKHVVLLLHEL
jgi:hypothetical protein